MSHASTLTVAIGQVAPLWLNRVKTLEKVMQAVSEAADRGAGFIAFGETLLPGYPIWLERTGGAQFNHPAQKRMQRHYLEQAVNVERGDLTPLCELAKARKIAIVIGCAERPDDRGGHSIYCSMVLIGDDGEIKHIHRKLMPTYEERLTWSVGDGNGLRTHKVGPFTVGALNCWENWLPLARAALYGQGENLHVGIWPGGEHNTRDTAPFIAKEGRCYSMAASAILRPSDIPSNTPLFDEIMSDAPAHFSNGGSCLASPTGEWIISPQVGNEGIFVAEIDFALVLEERHNFDPAGHYSRPDVLSLNINRQRQHTLNIVD
ncbi:carbon-nitrogen hydrolase family protein [Aestuariibacter sp. AA17]|uniref:Carbon-nitrogen hydrolase family protein n=1 Tax=Fluctibacter corallii TaxID=2984329 RepID=A0ABT3AAC7_9ALTE|nr:carbon-nitrogen hydrolase family protein [Aestuariibacter sp. AA17]MCV2885630.1 carbon-nitrogen hydrolase family protein [Aestuariibacter sp. AA17]